MKLPDDHAVSNDMLQEGHQDPESGSFTTYTCAVPFDDQGDFATKGWRFWLHWELPLVEGWNSIAKEKKKGGLSKTDYEKKKDARKAQLDGFKG
jgi:hypothetical protein